MRNMGKKFIRKKRKDESIDDDTMALIMNEIDQLMIRFPNKKACYYLIKLNFYLGLRVGELAALEEDDIDFENKVVHVTKGEVKYKVLDEAGNETGRRKCQISTPKTESGVRDIPLIQEAEEIAVSLFEYRKRKGYTDKRLAYDRYSKCKSYLDKLSGIYSRLSKKLGIPFRCHLQRKTYATRLTNNRVAASEIQKLMGHSNIQTTLNCYVLPESNSKEKLYGAVQAVFSTGSKEKC